MNPPSTSGSADREKIRCIYCDSEMERRNLKSPAEKPSLGKRTLSFSNCLTQLHLPNIVEKLSLIRQFMPDLSYDKCILSD